MQIFFMFSPTVFWSLSVIWNLLFMIYQSQQSALFCLWLVSSLKFLQHTVRLYKVGETKSEDFLQISPSLIYKGSQEGIILKIFLCVLFNGICTPSSVSWKIFSNILSFSIMLLHQFIVFSFIND